MKENLKDILSHLHSEVDQETLLKYLQGKLSAEEQHEVEKNLLDDPFEADAVEGLATIQNKQDISAFVNQLNRDLKKNTSPGKKWLFKREARLESWLLLSIILILVLAVIGYLVIHNMLR
jgi:hypothetical protein